MNKSHVTMTQNMGKTVLKTNTLSTVGSKTTSVREPDTILCQRAHKLNVSQIRNLKKRAI